MKVIDTPLTVLEQFVHESNAIGGIYAKPGEPLYSNHLRAAQIVAKGKLIHPNLLHKILSLNVAGLSDYGGMYRSFNTEVGPFDCSGNQKKVPRADVVPRLMDLWMTMVQSYYSSTHNSETEEMACVLHEWLLCIHPYVDGNGRTARLVWNMLRAAKGLPWYIQEARYKSAYRSEIQEVEVLFKERYKNVY
jgi:Fic family protein